MLHCNAMSHLIVDGSNLLYRSIPYKPDTAVGPHMPTYVFLKRIAETAERTYAKHVTVCWDGGTPPNRLAACPNYKANRKTPNKEKEDRKAQFQVNQDFLKEHILGPAAVRSITQRGMEADDLIFGFSSVVNMTSEKAFILSADMDLSQLVNKQTTLIPPGKDWLTDTTLPRMVMDDTYGIMPRFPSDVVLFKALRGDPADNIKPVVKPKVALRIWEEMLRTGTSPAPESIRLMCSRIGIDLDPQFERNFTAVDLIRSGVAGDAIGVALAAMAAPATFKEGDLFDAFSTTGMNPSALHAITSVLQCLR